MTRHQHRGSIVFALLIAMGGMGCAGETSSPSSISIEVAVVVAGDGTDPNGIAVILDARDRVDLSGAGVARFADVEAGPHRVTLTGVDSRCAVSPAPELDFEVAANDTARVEFTLECLTAAGAIQVVTRTSGPDADPDGYTVLLDDEHRIQVSSIDVQQFSAPEGAHRVSLAGLASNCEMVGEDVRMVEVTPWEVREVTFTIECTAVPRAGPGREIAFVSTRGADSLGGAVYIMNDDGTQVRRLSDTLSHEHASPAWSPDGSLLAIVAPTPTFGPAITLATAEGVLVRQLPMEHLVFFHDALSWTPDGTGILFNGHGEGCAPVIEARTDGSGESVVLVDEQCPDLILAFSYSPDGSRVAYLRTCLGSCNVSSSELVIRDATTLETIELPCSLPPGFSSKVAWSPDGRKVAVDAQSNLAEDLFGSEIWIIDLDARACTQITSGLAGGITPSWSPDGNRIAFVSTRDGNPEIYVMNADGSDQRRLTSNTVSDAEPAWRP